MTTEGSLRPGTKLGPYELVELIGRGGGGEVYRACDSRLDRDVAVKIVRGAKTREDVRRLEVEAKATAALNHPNIVAVYDVGLEHEVAFVVTELLEGENLRAALRRGRLEPARAIEYARQIVDALAAAHDKGIIHRDLKPENIFVLPGGRIKVLDFGLAKQMIADPGGALETASLLTVAGEVVGTPAYLAPEQARALAVDHRADIFSFGAVLCEMLTGASPFRRETLADTIAAIVRDPAPPLPLAAPALDRIVRRCLEKSPADRFQSARDLRFALDGISMPAVQPSPSPSPAVQASPSPVDTRRTRGRRPWTGRRRVFAIGLSIVVFRWGWSTGQRWLSDGQPSKSEPRVAAVGRETVAVSSVDAAMLQSAVEGLVDGINATVTRGDAAHVTVSAPYPQIRSIVSAITLVDALKRHRFEDEACVAGGAACSGALFAGEGQSSVKVSLAVQNVSAKGLMRLIAAGIGWPVLFDESVKGNVSLELNDVPWDLIVRSVLELQGLNLAATRFGDIWLVSSRVRASELANRHVEMWLYRPQRTSANDLALLLQRTFNAPVTVDERLKAIIVIDHVDAFSDYARVVSTADRAALDSLRAPRRAPDAYAGGRVSLDFDGAPLDAVIRALSGVSGTNIVIENNAAAGKTVTAGFRQTRWDNALEVLLLANRLRFAVQGNLIVVSDDQSQLGDLFVETVPLARENPGFLLQTLTRALSPRGSIVMIDEPKTLVIRDVRDRAVLIGEWARRIDSMPR